MFISKKELKNKAKKAEERAGYHYEKLFKIEKLIYNYERYNGNPYTLIRDIKNEIGC